MQNERDNGSEGVSASIPRIPSRQARTWAMDHTAAVGEWSQLLLGRKVTVATENTLHLDDGTTLRIKPNEGCSCGNGDYDITELNGVDNVITNVKYVTSTNGDQDTYELFVFADNQQINLLTVEGDDNGHYGQGFVVEVTR